MSHFNDDSIAHARDDRQSDQAEILHGSTRAVSGSFEESVYQTEDASTSACVQSSRDLWTTGFDDGDEGTEGSNETQDREERDEKQTDG